jgi:chromosome segregation ATPase
MLMPKIKLNFDGEEKILPEEPKNFLELNNLFQQMFFGEQIGNNNYIFCLDEEKTNSINGENFTEKMKEIKKMKDPKIYVENEIINQFNKGILCQTVLLNNSNKQNVEGNNENIEQNNNFDFNLIKESKSIELSKINKSGDLNNNYGEIVEIMEKEIKNTKNILDKEINRMEILNENLDILYCLDDLIRKNEENNKKIKSLEKENKEYLKKNEELLKKINLFKNEDKGQLIEKIQKLEKEIENYKNNMINIFKDEEDNNKNNANYDEKLEEENKTIENLRKINENNKIKELENEIKKKEEKIKNMTPEHNEDLEKINNYEEIIDKLHREKKSLEEVNDDQQLKIISLDKENKEKSNKINNLNDILAKKENQMNEEKKQLMEKLKKDAMVKLHQKIEEFGAKIDNIFGNLCNNIK